ncbi:MAG TPA: helix-turn-helix domain-containing protein, partial [Chthoniobacterales bacterium]
MPRTSDVEERLTNAAMELIWENSYGATSVDAICEKAGAKKGSFYHFFESKSALAVKALQADWRRKKARMDEIFSPTVSPLDRLTS